MLGILPPHTIYESDAKPSGPACWASALRMHLHGGCPTGLGTLWLPRGKGVAPP